nr:hypothetical protein [Tanacetum cinerariifolium]
MLACSHYRNVSKQTTRGDVDEEGENDEEDDNEETRDDESFNPIPQTSKSSEDEGYGEEDQGLRISEEERLNEEEEAEELYREVNINQGRGIQATLDVEDSHVTLTPVHLDGQQESSSVSSHFMTSMLNQPSDVGMQSIFATASSSVAPLQTSTPIMTPSTIATITTISHAPIPPMTISSKVLQKLPTFDSVFRFEDRLKSLEASFSKYIQTNSFAEAVSNIPNEQRNLYKALVDAYEADKTILDSYGETVILKRKRDDDDDDQDEGPFAGSDRGSKRRIEDKEPESASAPLETATMSTCRSTTGSKSRQVSASESAFIEEPVQTTSQMDEPSHSVFETGADDQLIVQSSQHPEMFSQPKKPPTPDHDWNKTLPAPLSLIPDNRGRRVIPFAHFINNDLEYLRGGASSRKYTTSVTKTKIKRIEDLVPRTMWIQEPIDYDKHALWGVSHWGQTRQQFYGFPVNQESALDVYSKRRIIAVTDLKIVE